MRELTPTSIILGIVIGVVMGAANAYIGLKYGLVISASIPAAVISMGILRGILRRGTLLENNMVQTIGSAGESLAAGVIFTVPALFILGHEYPEVGMAPEGVTGHLKIVAFGVLGGLLGVLMMIPMRRYLIVKGHGKLRYPEGVACAEVLKSGQSGATGATLVFGGMAIGLIHKFVGGGLGLWKERVVIPVKTAWFDLRTVVSMEAVTVLLGVGFILGARVSAIMVGGGLLAWLGIIPLIAYFGQFINEPLAPATMLIRDMSPDDIWTNYIRYIGAGGVAFGGLISLFKALPTIGASLWHATTQLIGSRGKVDERTDRDLPIWVVGGGTLLVLFGVWIMNRGHETALWGTLAVAVFGFVFVAVAARIVADIGNSSSPISGMTIATLLGTGLLFTGMGFSGPETMAAAIGVGAVVCIALAIAGDCSQDLKTGYLVGATPARQQTGEMIGVVTSAITCAVVLMFLKDTYGFVPDDPSMLAAGVEPRETLLAAQANVIAMLLKGILDTGLPWELVLVGMACAFMVECLGVSSLAFAVGLYLPLYVTTPIFAGGLLQWAVAGRKKNHGGTTAGVLGASGLVAGDALMALGLAGLTLAGAESDSWLNALAGNSSFGFLADLIAWRDADGAAWHGWVVTLVPFALIMLWLSLITWLHRGRRGAEPETPPVIAPVSTIQPEEPPAETPQPEIAAVPVVQAEEPPTEATLPVWEPDPLPEAPERTPAEDPFAIETPPVEPEIAEIDLPAIPFDDTPQDPVAQPAPVEEEPPATESEPSGDLNLDDWLGGESNDDADDWFGTDKDDNEDDPLLENPQP